LWSWCGALTDLGTLGGTDSVALGVNDLGDVVEHAHVAGDTFHAFVYRGGVLLDVNSLIPAGSGLTLTDALDINNRGQIVGWGFNANDERRAFLLAPVPEPSSALALATLLAGAMVGRRRRRRPACGRTA
jgi:probable HAF family extracellular repeat protein